MNPGSDDVKDGWNTGQNGPVASAAPDEAVRRHLPRGPAGRSGRRAGARPDWNLPLTIVGSL